MVLLGKRAVAQESCSQDAEISLSKPATQKKSGDLHKTVATQPRQLHHSNNFIKKKSRTYDCRNYKKTHTKKKKKKKCDFLSGKQEEVNKLSSKNRSLF